MHERTEHHEHRAQPTLVVDETGTLTEGRPKLVSVVTAPGFDEVTLLRLAATLERGSEHPLAAAIVRPGKEDSRHGENWHFHEE